MKYVILIISGIFLVWIFSLFFINQKDSSNPVVLSSVPSKEYTIYGSWRWIRTLDYSQTVLEAKNPDAFILTVTPEGKLTSTTDCNSITGSVIINGEVISIGALSITEMACEGETQETIYLNDLARATSYIIEEDILTIQQIKDFGVMTFERVGE